MSPEQIIDQLGWTREHVVACAISPRMSWMRTWREDARQAGIDPEVLRDWCKEQMWAEGVISDD